MRVGDVCVWISQLPRVRCGISLPAFVRTFVCCPRSCASPSAGMTRRRGVYDPEADGVNATPPSGRKPKKKPESGKDINAVIAKKIRDNFKGWSAVSIDGALCGRLTLRQTLTRDYKLHLANPKVPFGASYYAKVKEVFRSADPAAKQFAPRSPNDPVSPALLAAIKETQHYHRNVQPLITQLAITAPCNQKELCGILKSQETLSPSVSQMQWSTALTIAKYCASQGFLQTFPAEMQAARTQWGKAFVAAFGSMHRDGMDIQAFIELHSASLPLALCLSDVMLLLNRKGPWSGVRDALGRVVGASLIGKRMFSFAMVHIIAFEVSEVIEKQVAEALGQKCTAESIKLVKQKTVAFVNGMIGIELLPDKRLVSMSYRGVIVKATVDSIYDEVDKRLAAGLKELALGAGKLAPLLCEADLVSLEATEWAGGVAGDLLGDFRLARSQANNLLGSVSWSCGEEFCLRGWSRRSSSSHRSTRRVRSMSPFSRSCPKSPGPPCSTRRCWRACPTTSATSRRSRRRSSSASCRRGMRTSSLTPQARGTSRSSGTWSESRHADVTPDRRRRDEPLLPGGVGPLAVFHRPRGRLIAARQAEAVVAGQACLVMDVG